jgi:hypothetical protein
MLWATRRWQVTDDIGNRMTPGRQDTLGGTPQSDIFQGFDHGFWVFAL